ncbi:MAG: hypothetical protein FD189_468 [Elusimicrobia bacterium]|nr:MAG: hypothetical protein FD154_497 [Elusimicrobiota bacterium]KAF0157693.1 MAG: hypothetical protein FD189_468 [Elusimicrobiota bacterium]
MALVLLVVLAIIVPVMVTYVRNEANWSVKQGQSSNALQLAEAALDRGFQKVIESTATWKALQAGQTFPGFVLDTAYTELPGGSYAVAVTSGPHTGEVTIVGVGRDRMNREVRALKAVYLNDVLSEITIQADNGVTMSGNNVQVEWGAVASPKDVDINGKIHPSFWSAANIKNSDSVVHRDNNGPTPPNCDSPNCWWWHSYYTDLPPSPQIDFAAYRSSAIASGNDPCGRPYYQPGNFSNNCTSNTGKPYFIEGNWTNFRSAVAGAIIVMGNLTFQNGVPLQLGARNARVPPKAWKQYCNNWSHYLDDYDPGLKIPTPPPACFGDINTSYAPTGLTKSINPAIHGFVYVGGNFTPPTGGGSADLIHGSIMVKGAANITTNSQCRIYYDPQVAANIMTIGLNLSRKSWEAIVLPWPSGL